MKIVANDNAGFTNTRTVAPDPLARNPSSFNWVTFRANMFLVSCHTMEFYYACE